MAAGFDQSAVGFDSADYTFDGTFLGVVGGALFLSALTTARNIAAAVSGNTNVSDPFYALSITSRNKADV